MYELLGRGNIDWCELSISATNIIYTQQNVASGRIKFFVLDDSALIVNTKNEAERNRGLVIMRLRKIFRGSGGVQFRF